MSICEFYGVEEGHAGRARGWSIADRVAAELAQGWEELPEAEREFVEGMSQLARRFRERVEQEMAPTPPAEHL